MRNLKKLYPILISCILLIISIGICIYFDVNKWVVLSLFILGATVLGLLSKISIENMLLTNDNDSLNFENEMLTQAQIISVKNPSNIHQTDLSVQNEQTSYQDVSKSSQTRLKDVAGCSEAKEEVMEIIDFLKNPNKYHEAGAKLPKGILFEGPPGTGKTLLAKAVAGEAGVKFLATSGSEFMEMFVGKGAQRVRELFAEASKEPTLIFIDEIDAIGGKRGMSAGNDTERERTLNQLLVEMDGFNEKKDIVVIAATNRKDMLDSALLRPGRFERHIKIGLPTTAERKEILEVHAQNKTFANNVSIDSLAKKTSMFSGAELSSLLNEAALMSVRNHREAITMADCEEALDRVIMGPARKSRKYIEKEKRLVAYHEAGHAVIGLKLNSSTKIERITIIPRGDAGGYNLFSDKEDVFFDTKQTILEEIVGYLGGRVAEEIIFNDISSGASNDLEKATNLAQKFVCDYGMSELGMIQISKLDIISDTMKEAINKQINKIIEECYQQAKEIIQSNQALLEAIAQTLLENETIDADEIQKIALSY